MIAQADFRRPEPMKISTGDPSTLRTYRKIAEVFGPKAVAFIDDKARASKNGFDEEVLAPETQMLYLLSTMMEPKEKP